jgi:hypothetical protein
LALNYGPYDNGHVILALNTHQNKSAIKNIAPIEGEIANIGYVLILSSLDLSSLFRIKIAD